MPSDPVFSSARWALLGAAAVAAFQGFLWAKVEFWSGLAAAAVVAAVLIGVAVSLPSWTFPARAGRPFRFHRAAAWLLLALLSVLCILPIRAGALQSRSFERIVLAVLAFTALLALFMASQSVFRAVMRRRGLRTPVLLFLGCVLVAFLSADLMHWMRPSGLSAVACTTTLFRRKPDTAQLLEAHRATIVAQAALRDLPAALVAAVMIDHQNQQSSSGDFSDCLGSALGVNLSLGLSQVRLGTAALIDGRSLADLSASEYRQLRSALLTPGSNIAYEARELRSLMQRPGRFPGMSASALLHDPAAMALLVSEYRKGRMATAATKSPLNINAFSTLGLMQDGTVAAFYRPEEDPVRARALIRAYLGQVYCHSGIFNESACSAWRRNLRT